MKNLIAAALAFTLAACATTQAPIRCTEERNTVTVHAIWISADKIARHCETMGAFLVDGYKSNACARYHPASNTLTVWAVKPQSVDDYDRLRDLGHEVMHGLCVPFHDKTKELGPKWDPMNIHGKPMNQ